MLWSSGDELDDGDVLTYLFIYSAVYQDMFTITVNSDVFIVYSDDCKYINYSDLFCKNLLLSIIYCSAAIVRF